MTLKTRKRETGKITFGNIMLSLLVVGVFVVIGLITKLYLELTHTPQETAANYQRQQEKQAQVEIMCPGDKTGKNCVPSGTSNAASAEKTQAAQAQPQAQVRDDEPPLIDSSIPAADNEEKIQKTATTKKAVSKPKPVKRKDSEMPDQGERELHPINTPNSNSESQPTYTRESTVRETRSLRYSEPEKSGSRDLDPLF